MLFLFATTPSLSLRVRRRPIYSPKQIIVGRSTGQISRQLAVRCLSVGASESRRPASPRNHLQVWEYDASALSRIRMVGDELNTKSLNAHAANAALYRPSQASTSMPGSDVTAGWEKVQNYAGMAKGEDGANVLQHAQNKASDVVNHFLPAGFPNTVAPGYARYATYCLLGSIAGSAGMVLSTQALLVAVGVGTHHAVPVAAALNWVVKDGLGQLGGVLFASKLGSGGAGRRGGTADTDPKRWRMVAALAVDVSTLVEICTPMLGSNWFLPLASLANMGKNVGFLAASASKAAVHQSLATGGKIEEGVMESPEKESSNKSNAENLTNEPKKSKQVSSNEKTIEEIATAIHASNLGDVTAKAGSQSIVASLLGTAVGISLSRTFCTDTSGVLMGFVALSTMHQAFTYAALRAVALRTLNRHRLHLILASYAVVFCASSSVPLQKEVLSPRQVADRESFYPFFEPDDSSLWLTIGSRLIDVCPSGPNELEKMMLPRKICEERHEWDSSFYENYVLRITARERVEGVHVRLTFLDGARDEDILRGMLHAYIVQANASMGFSFESDGSEYQLMMETHQVMTSHAQNLLTSLRRAGWEFGNGFVNVECGKSRRLCFEKWSNEQQ